MILCLSFLGVERNTDDRVSYKRRSAPKIDLKENKYYTYVDYREPGN